MYAIGVMPMPAGFKYRDVLLKGKPRHDRYDSFRIRHPKMDPGKRVLMKNEIYTDKVGLSPEDQEELDRRFSILHNLTYNSRMARANHVHVTISYYEACSDVNSEAYGLQGQYKTVTGICWNVDAEVTKTILVDGMRIRMEDIREIESPEKLFETRWEDQSSDWDT